MADDDLQLACGLAHQLDGALGDIAMGRAVEAVAAEMIFLIILRGDGVAIGLRGHGHMERSVEHGDLGLARHDLLAGLDAHEVGRVVERAEGDAVADGLLAGFVDDAGFNELVAAVQHAMADGIDLVRGLQNTVLRIDKDGQDGLNGFGMRGHGDVALDLQTGGGDLVCQLAIDVDALAQALGEDLTGGRVHQLVLQRRAACIDHENFHGCVNSCKNIVFFSSIS